MAADLTRPRAAAASPAEATGSSGSDRVEQINRAGLAAAVAVAAAQGLPPSDPRVLSG